MLQFTQPIPLTLYIHLPWCIRKCPYCDFNSHALRNSLPENEYIDALIKDLDQDLSKIWGRRISAIFFGGGTPSLFSPSAIERLLNAIHARLPFNSELEITMEANPGTVEQNRFKGFRSAGVNRLSIGIQSFQNDKLKVLGRIHNGEEAKHAVQITTEAGFENFNLDLMFGLPQQTQEDALYDLQTAISCAPKHLSWYQLTMEPNTLFYKQPPPLPADEEIWQIQNSGQQLLSKQGFQQYEISAYCKTNYECKHNVNYWEFGDYLGIGAGAHSKITSPAKAEVIRFSKFRNPKDYMDINKNFIDEEKVINKSELPFEFMLNALRLQKTIPIKLFIDRTGLPLSDIQEKLHAAREKELLQWNEENLIVTEKGKNFLNDLQEMFLR